MAHNLEAPGSDAAPEYESLYRARGDEVVLQRPIFTGDVFFDVSVEGEEQTRNVIVLQHPCVIRRGVELTPKLLVAEVASAALLPPSQWAAKFFRQLPLAELVAGDKPNHFAAFFDRHHLIKRKDLELDHRVATMSQRGVNLLMQRWVHHNSRMIVPTQEYQKVTGAQYDEADIIEEWCIDREDDGVSLDNATVEIDTWLTGDKSPMSPRARLEDPQQRSAIRREVRLYLLERRST
jgi:hypothetical protein